MDIEFYLSRYENKKGCGKIVFVREGITAKLMKELECKISEIICIELTKFSKKKCLVVCLYTFTKQ